MFTYLIIKDRQAWMEKDDNEEIAKALLICLFTILGDLLLLLLQPILILLYVLMTKKGGE